MGENAPARQPPTDVELARQLDADIRAVARQVHIGLDALAELVDEARAAGIHEVLGFSSWTAYIADALDGQWKVERDKRGEVVKFLAEQGMSLRAIAATTGVSKNTVSRDLAGVPLGHLVTGMDGKTYTRPEPREAEPDEDICPLTGEAHRTMRITIPATIDAAMERLREIGDEEEQLHQRLFELELQRFHGAPVGTAERNAYSLGLWWRYKHRWARHIYAQSGAASVEEFAQLLNAPVEGVAELLADEDTDEDDGGADA